MAKIGMPRTGGEDQEIVIEFAVGHFHLFCIDIHRLHFGKNHLYVFPFAQNRAHGSSNVGRRKRCGRDLIEQRLEKMIVRAVDHHYPYFFAGKLFRSLKSAESRADDDYVRLRWRRVLHTNNLPATTPDESSKFQAKARDLLDIGVWSF